MLGNGQRGSSGLRWPAARSSASSPWARPARRPSARQALALGLVVLGTMLLASVASAAGNPPGVRVIHTKEIIESFAIGGQRVAYDVQGRSLACNKVLVRDLRTGKTTRVSGKQTCSADSTSTGAGVRELPRDGVTLVLWRDPKVVLGDRSARTPT